MFSLMFSFFTASLGALSMSFGLFLSPIIIGICKRKSTRLTAVIGGLVLSLGCLFSSFANQFHQLYFSHAVMTGKKWLSRTACCARSPYSRLKNCKFLMSTLYTIDRAITSLLWQYATTGQKILKSPCQKN